MSNQYFNFYYDPIQQGYDNSNWRTLYGAVVVGGGRLRLNNAAILHYADILRGDASFSLNLAAPIVGIDRKFGFLQYNKNAYAYFKILNDVITCETSNGTITNSLTIDWQLAWTNTDTEFRVQWEAGRATFYVGGISQAVINDISVTGDPMSLYIYDNSDDTFLLNYVNVKTIQSYIMNDGDNGTGFQALVDLPDKISITESITTFGGDLDLSLSDTLTITENVIMSNPSDNKSLSDSLTISENIAIVQT